MARLATALSKDEVDVVRFVFGGWWYSRISGVPVREGGWFACPQYGLEYTLGLRAATQDRLFKRLAARGYTQRRYFGGPDVQRAYGVPMVRFIRVSKKRIIGDGLMPKLENC